MHVRQLGLDSARRVDKGAAIIVMRLDARRHRENIRIEDDVFRREANRLGQNLVGAPADLEFARRGFGLARFVERHDHHRRAIAQDLLRLRDERLLALLQADRIHDRLALHAFQACLDHRPFRGIDHDRDAGDVRLGGNQIEERCHRRFGIDHALVHIDVEHVARRSRPAAARTSSAAA